jgi:hemolysin-activating ACP:hemolysin acyltransferase
MPKFLAIYTGTATAREKSEWDKVDEARRRELEAAGMQAWGKWASDNAAAIVDNGAPLGKTKRIARDGITDITNTMAAYVIVEADSHEAAARLFENHPHFSIFPGDSVEVMPCLEMPGSTG